MDDQLTHVSIPAGTYALYLLAEGSPVSVTLRLEGLKRSAAIRPLTAAISSEPTGVSWWYADAMAMTRVGARVMWLSLR